MDFGKFKKVSSNQSSTTLQHPDGHKIKVAHAALPPDTRKKLEAQPMHYEKGGPVLPPPIRPGPGMSSAEPEPAVPDYRYNEANDPQAIAQANANKFADRLGSKGMEADPDPVQAAAPQFEQPSNIELPQTPQQAGGMQMPAMPTGGVNMQMQALNDNAKAQAQQGQADAAAADDHAQQAAALAEHTNKQFEDINHERQGLMADYANGHIDPNHYMDSKSGGAKVSTAIGLLLGGISGGISGGPNPVMEFLNKQIDRDIDAQKENMGKNKTLLEFNHQKFGDAQAANAITKSQLLDIYATKIAKAAAEAKGPLAASQAKMAIGQLKAQADQLAYQVAQTQGMKSAVAGGAISHEQAMPYVVPKEAQEPVRKALSDARENEQMRQWANDNAEKLASMSMNGTFSPSQRQAMIGPLAGFIEKKGEGRYNHDAAQTIAEGMFPNKTDFSGDTKNIKAQQRNAFFDGNLQKNNSVISSYLPPIKSSQSKINKR